MRRLITLIASYFVITISGNGNAQVIPDQSLPNNSVVNDELEVVGGTVAGNNLFHSFREFSVNTGETVFFDNNSAIAHIISRVTGNSVSRIDGLLRANSNADLFLINPNGIIFGENATLDIGGSFISTTADSIQFVDGSEFSAVNPNASPLLTVSIPVGLQYGNSSGDITVAGAGNNLNIDLDTFTVNRSDRPIGLKVSKGNTLALLGGNVLLSGGNVTAAEGRVAVGSIEGNGLVKLNADPLGWNFDYSGVSNFNRIDLSQAASIEVSGNGGGEVRLQGREINLRDGAAILADTLGDSAGKSLEISATENITLIGFTPDSFFPTRLSTDVDLDGTADGGNLVLNTNYLLIADGAQVNSGTFGLGNAGNLNVFASEIEVLGESGDGEFASGLFAQADLGETGNGGNLAIETDLLLVAEGADISTTTFGLGDAGNLNIQANTIELAGFSNSFISGSGLSVTTEGAGNGGNLTLSTDSLLITGGADISTATFGSGDAGNLSIQANTIELNGGAGGIGSSGLFANVEAASLGDGGNLNIEANQLNIVNGAQIVASTFSTGEAGTLNIDSQVINIAGASPGGIPSGIFATALLSDGAGGNIVINSDLFSLLDNGTISVSNIPNANIPFEPGQGAAGNITITAAKIRLDTQAAITANTFTGDRGNIDFQTDLLVLRRGSTISTDAQEMATGGNITIDASNGFVLAFPQENSDITANAMFGDGGGVDISALEIFGIEPSSSLTTFSDITASSEFGIAGSVSLNTQDLDPVENLNKLPNTLNPPQLDQGCSVTEASNSSFVNLGQGGLNPQADQALGGGGEDILGDVQIPTQWSDSEVSNNIVEAESWIVNKQGKVVLIADISTRSFTARCQ